MHPADDTMQRERWVFTFSVEGDLRFISHRDTMRVFQRALARAALPVHYTEGFNPHARLSLPLPRPVGVASQAEAVVIEFDTPVQGKDVVEKLNEHLPGLIRIHDARRLDPRGRMIPELARYRVSPVFGGALPFATESDILERITNLLDADNAYVERADAKTRRTRRIDVRPYIAEIVIQGDAVEFTLRITPGGTAKPAEIVTLLGLDTEAVGYRIRRLDVQWMGDGQ